MKNIRRGTIGLLLVMLLMAVMPILAYAIDDPDTSPEVRAVYVYGNGLLEDGDLGVLIDYYIDYTIAGNPTETVTDAYLAVFVDTDGTTQLVSVAPYTFQDSGYGRGLAWIYFTAAEVVTYSLDSADEALYRIWLTGNPSLDWDADPPKTIATIDEWAVTGDMSVLLALRVLHYADVLELAWSLDMIEETSLGNRLTSLGSDYFVNTIPNLRTMAPGSFSAGTLEPTPQNLDFSTTFGAIFSDLGGTAGGSPITLSEGNNDVDVQILGTFTVVLLQGTIGTATSDVCTVTGSPVELVAGTNTITTTTGIGNIVVAVELKDTSTGLEDTVIGTGLDLTTIAAIFGLSRWMFSGLVWLIVTIVICAGVYKLGDRGLGSGNKAIMLVFAVCIIGGTLLGLMHPLVAIALFLGNGALITYVIFFRGANV